MLDQKFMIENHSSDRPGGSQKTVATIQRFYALIILGLFLVFTGFLIMIVSSSSEISGGGVIFIGPFPIIFGVGQNFQFILTLSLIIAIIMLILFIVMKKESFLL